MLDRITDNFSTIFNKLGLNKKLTEANIQEGIRDIRMALIEADVALPVIKSFVAKVKEKTLGTEILKGVASREMFIQAVHRSLVDFLGSGEYKGFELLEPTRTTHILLCGLQGSGKTTTIGKIGNHLKNTRNCIAVSLDIYRPAANEQLKIISEQAGIAFFDRGDRTDLKGIIKEAKKYAEKNVYNCILWDTAGRIQVDFELMKELSQVSKWITPNETVLICDSMTGQQALSVAEEFKKAVKIDSLIFTKFDSGTRGGAVLSVKEIVGSPVKYIGIGEKIQDFDEFVPSRIADRMLGMGDIVALVNKAQDVVDEKKASRIAEKIKKNEFDLSDFLEQLEQLNKMGSLQSVLEMVPGMRQKIKNANIDENQFNKLKYIIQSMTLKEKEKPFIINNSRKQRIAKGCGYTIMDVNRLIKRFNEMKSMMKQMSSSAKMKKMMSRLMGGDVDMSMLK